MSPILDLRVGGITLKAVDQIGAVAASEIRQAATELRKGADEVAAQLELLADAVTGHSKTASGYVAAFVDHTRDVIETVRLLQERKNGNGNNTKNGDGRVLEDTQSGELSEHQSGGVGDLRGEPGIKLSTDQGGGAD